MLKRTRDRTSLNLVCGIEAICAGFTRIICDVPCQIECSVNAIGLLISAPKFVKHCSTPDINLEANK
jgi:hypothetical protein